ncbi:MAG: fibronectin type III domain-containing protein [Sphingobacteriia bacterium]|nr:fibronectin type III domain-containing protein [Sphingobacteriia bacterium]
MNYKRLLLLLLTFVSVLMVQTGCKKDDKEENTPTASTLKVEILFPKADTVIQNTGNASFFIKVTPSELQNKVITTVYVDDNVGYVLAVGEPNYTFSGMKYGVGNHKVRFEVEDPDKRKSSIERVVSVYKYIPVIDYVDSVAFEKGETPKGWIVSKAEMSSEGYLDEFSLKLNSGGDIKIPLKYYNEDFYFSFVCKGTGSVNLTTDLTALPVIPKKEDLGEGWFRNTFLLSEATMEVILSQTSGSLLIDNVIIRKLSSPLFDEVKCDTVALYDHYAIFSARINSITGKSVRSGICWSNILVKPTVNDNHLELTTGLSNFSFNIKPFKKGSKAFVRLYTVNDAGISYSKAFAIGPALVRPADVEWNGSNDVYADSVIMQKAKVTDEYLSPVVERGYCMSIHENPTINDRRVRITSATAAFYGGIGLLDENQTYYARAYAISNGGVGYSQAYQITTTEIQPPEVYTRKAINIRRSTATCQGNIFFTGQGTLLRRGIVYSLNSMPELGVDPEISLASQKKIITADLTGLQANTTYYYRAFAVNKKYTSFGEVMSFTTGNYDLLDQAEGGRIIYLEEGGNHGVAVAEQDLGTPVIWAQDTTMIIGSVNSTSGIENTELIASKTIGEDNAANRCYNLDLNGYNDWFLPSFEEFKIYLPGLTLYGLTTGNYWLSTERAANKALIMNLSSLTAKNERKSKLRQVRPFRKF